MNKQNLKTLLGIGSFAAVLTLIVGLASYYPSLRNAQLTSAQSCGDSDYLFANPDGYSFTQGSLVPGEVMYNNDNRFNILSVPTALQGAKYIKTDNNGLKDSVDNKVWAIYPCKPGKVYVLYRRITGQNPPSWITTGFTKETPNTVTEANLSSFLVRKNVENIRGVYDIYSLDVPVPKIILLKGASTNSSQAHSMYLVAVRPQGLVPLPPTTPVGTSGSTATPRPSSTTTATPRPSVTASSRPTPTPVRTNSPTPVPTAAQTPVGGAQYPAQVLNLTNWKVTMPTSGAPETEQPALATFKLDPWFIVNPTGGVRFRAAVNGGTTGGSSNPRSELREMAYTIPSIRCPDEPDDPRACWSTSNGTHTMFIDQMVTALPGPDKPHVVVGQIHDGGDDVTVFRVEGTELWITRGNTTHGYLVDNNFQLNKRFTVKFEVANNVTKYYYNGNLLPYTLNQSYSGAYFKAGAYTQANCSNNSPCSASNYGEVVIYNLQVTH